MSPSASAYERWSHDTTDSEVISKSHERGCDFLSGFERNIKKDSCRPVYLSRERSDHNRGLPLKQSSYICVERKQKHYVFNSIAGVSRSTSVLVAYLVTVADVDWEVALTAVQARRSCASPNEGFRKQLIEFQNLRAQVYIYISLIISHRYI